VRFNSKIFSVSLSLGIAFWIIDAGMETLVFGEGSFLDLALLDVPTQELVHRVIVLALLLAFGFIISSVHFRREEMAREASRKALAESEERFRELAELLPEPVFETDLTFTVKG